MNFKCSHCHKLNSEYWAICEPCRVKQTAIAWRKSCDAILKSNKYFRALNIDLICAQHELKSDEFYTANQKAINHMKTAPMR